MYKTFNYPLIALLVFAARLTVFGAGVGDALALGALAALYGFGLYLTHTKQVPLNDEVKKEILDMRSAINALKIARSYGK